jgi:hypothetical protein
LRPSPQVKSELIGELIASLNHEQYPVRQKATRALEQLGPQVGPALTKAMAAKVSPEAHKRLQSILDKLASPATDPEFLRPLRAIEVLERIGTPETLEILGHLSRGAAEAPLTREALAARDRLAARLRKTP